jgi:hypothetical protein
MIVTCCKVEGWLRNEVKPGETSVMLNGAFEAVPTHYLADMKQQ